MNTPAELTAALKQLHVRVGAPSYRQLEAITRDSSHPLRRSTIADILAGRRMPSAPVLEEFLRACRVEPGEVVAWREAWERVELRRASRSHIDDVCMPRSVTPRAGGFWGKLTRDQQAAFRASAGTAAAVLGEVLWREGETGDFVAVIMVGRVAVSVDWEGRERLIAVREAGDIIGERAMMTPQRRSGTVVALGDVTVLVMSTRKFAEFLEEHPQVFAVLEEELYERLAEESEQLTADVQGVLTEHDRARAYERRLGGHHKRRRSVQQHRAHPTAWSTPPAGNACDERGLTVPFWSGQACTIMFIAIVGGNVPGRSDEDLLEVKRIMYEALEEAFAISRVPWDDCHREDRGDGVLIVVPPEVPTASVVNPMIPWVAARLRRHNRRSSEALHVRLKIALHVGPVIADGASMSGWPVDYSAHLLDVEPLKQPLAAGDASVGFIASSFVYESAIAHGSGSAEAADYEPVSTKVDQTDVTGWMYLPGVVSQSAGEARRDPPGYELTELEAALLGMVTSGLGDDQIAEQLALSEADVRRRMREIRDKLARDRSGAAPGAKRSATALTLAHLNARLG
ncbi:cyclic nucleotide-binding domain-containing protein [Spirillospora sp. NPDC052242]